MGNLEDALQMCELAMEKGVDEKESGALDFKNAILAKMQQIEEAPTASEQTAKPNTQAATNLSC